jgi:hypothetical protein
MTMPMTFPSDKMDASLYHRFFDDFNAPASATASEAMAYTSVDDAGTGTNAFQDVAGGVYNVVTAAADNDYHAMRSVSKSWTFAAGKELWLEAKLKVAEATTDDSTWWIGFTDTTTTGGMQANESGPLTSYTGALVYKKPEVGLTINAHASAAAVQSALAGFATSVSNTDAKVQIHWDGVDKISFWFYNGTSWAKAGSVPFTAGTTAMYLIFGIKAGPGAAAETLQMDYIEIVQQR